LCPQDINRFLIRHAQSRTPKVAQLMVTALRSFFRFLFQHGETEGDLSKAVLTVPSWRLAEVPKYLKPEEVECLLHACDRTTPIGRRNHAVLLLLARLGLRAGEVVTLELDDINWRAGELTVRGKGNYRDRLPLPRDAGEALATYLRHDRPACSTRKVFVRMRAPHQGFRHPSTVSTIVCRALEKAGLTPPIKGAHLLRHSLATGMLRRGSSMAEIGEVLRHWSPNSTEIYAKVDTEGLRSIARPWPGRGGKR
jgi:site-specific recombinase XerD